MTPITWRATPRVSTGCASASKPGHLGARGNGRQLARPALDAPGECKSNVEIFRQLAFRMGFDDACFRDSEDDMIRTMLASGHPFLEGITLERLEREHFVRLNVAPDGEPY